MRLSNLHIGILSLIAFSAFSQSQFKYIHSADSINLGLQKHDEGDYERAIELYSYVSPGDTNYQLALYEKCLSLVDNKQYDEGIELAKTGVGFKNFYEGQFYNLLGTCHDLKGQKKEAIEDYTHALERFPLDYELYYNRAVVYQGLEDYPAMLADLKKAVEINPFHLNSHLALATLALNERQYAQALLAMGYYLMLHPNTQTANDNLVLFNTVVSEQIELDSKGLEFGNEKDFQKINQLITSYAALRDDYKTTSKITFPFVKQLHLAIDQSLKIKERKGFWENYYLPFYEDVMNTESFEVFSYRILLSSGNSKHRKIFEKNDKEIKEYKDRLAGLIKEIYGLHHAGYISTNEEIKYWFFDDYTRVRAIGNVNSKDIPVGEYKYYYTSGSLSAKGHFDEQGERDGEWLFYHTNGSLKEKALYKDGKLNGPSTDYFENGFKNIESAFTDDMRDGSTCVFRESGTLARCMNHKKGQLEDSLVYYYDDKTVETWLPMNDGLIDGTALYYRADGTLSSSLTWKNDKKEGPFEATYSNGNIYSKGSYKEGNYQGPYTSYYPNGQISSAGSYSDGVKVGEWKHYYYDGKLSKLETFDEAGKATGHEELYDYNGYKTASFEKLKGEIQSYEIYNREGEVQQSVKRKRGSFWYEDYTLDGVKTIEGNYEGDSKVGLWKYYSANGTLQSEETFDENGLSTGTWKYFHPNGQLKRQYTVTTDTLNGYDVSYYSNGQMSDQGYNWKGKAQGRREYYYPDGTLKSVNFYVNGDYNGPQYYYNVEGDLYLIEYYKMGISTKIESCAKDSISYYTHEVSHPDGNLIRKYPNGTVLNKLPMAGDKLYGNGIWYYGNGKVESQGAYLDGDRHGVWKWFYPNGKTKQEGLYTLGVKDGVWTSYHPNGKVENTFNYENGNLHGDIIYYYEDGALETKTTYFQGEVNGKRYFYDYNGEVDHIRLYDQGRIIGYSYLLPDGTEAPIKTISKETAEVISYFKNGKVSRTYNLKNGLFYGDYVSYNQDGTVRTKSFYEDDIKTGLASTYFENGKLQTEANYLNDLLHGEYLEYHPNGKLKSRKHYLNNTLHGIAEEYNSSGTLVKKYNYQNGLLYDEL